MQLCNISTYQVKLFALESAFIFISGLQPLLNTGRPDTPYLLLIAHTLPQQGLAAIGQHKNIFADVFSVPAQAKWHFINPERPDDESSC